MKRIVSFLAVIGVAAMITLSVRQLVLADAPTSGVGGMLSIGVPTPAGSDFTVPITTSASVDPYKGHNIHLTWDPSLVAFSSFSITGGTLGSSPLCLTAVDGDGGGVVIACSARGGLSTTAAGLLVNIVVTALGPAGCTPLHLVTLHAPDNGNTTFGSYTINAADISSQENTYGPDRFLSVNGGVCPTATATITPTPTNSPTRTPTSTPTVSPTPTVTPDLGAPDLVVGLFATPTAVDSAQTVGHSVFVANRGINTAENSTASLTLPTGAVLISNPGCPFYTAGVFTCQLGSLAADNGVPGGPDEAIVSLIARAPYSTRNLVIESNADVAASNEPSGNTVNNHASVVLTVRGCPDFNGDDSVNALDLGLFINALLSSTNSPNYDADIDLDDDGSISGLDLSVLAQRYLDSCAGLDSDDDGLPDSAELNTYLTCPGTKAAYASLSQCHVGGNVGGPIIGDTADTDGDGLPDGIEVYTFQSNPLRTDSDNDWYLDGVETGIGKDPATFCVIMAADITMDGSVSALDLAELALAFGSTSSDPNFNPRADINKNGVNDGLDLGTIATTFARLITACP